MRPVSRTSLTTDYRHTSVTCGGLPDSRGHVFYSLALGNSGRSLFILVVEWKSFRTGRLERELQMVQLSATLCSCIAILWVSLVSFVAITLWRGRQLVIPKVNVYFVMTQSGNFWIHPRITLNGSML
jgi:hypothetical protein